MPKAHVNGINLYYEQEGSGYPLVLISGYTADNSAWMLIRQELAKHFSLILVDNRGAGRSDIPDSPYTVETMAEDVRALIESLRLKKPHIVGHSMGGAIAQSLAFKYPQIAGKLVLANSLIRMHPVPAYALRYFCRMRAQGMTALKMREGSMAWVFSGNFLKNESQVASLLQKFEQYPYAQTLEGQKGQLDAVLQFDSSSYYKQIAAPVLVIEGDEDIICPGDSKRLAKGISGAKHVTFTGQAHMPHVEMPVEFANAVIQFL
jgi:3-oxoadipate enol-lactonase